MGWWTDLAEKRGPVINSGDGDGKTGETQDRAVECRGLILHVADGYYEGTIYWQHNPVAEVSSQFVVAGPRDVPKGVQDGTLAQCVDTDERAWTQRSGNGHWLSIECSGFSGDALSPAQIESCAKIFARGHRVYGYPLQLATSPSGYGLGHHSMGAESGVDWGHSRCPGEQIKAQKSQILAQAMAIVNGAQEEDMIENEDYKALLWRIDALERGSDEVAGGPTAGNPFAANVSIHDIQAKIAALDVKLTAIADLLASGAGPGGLTEAQVAAVVRAELDQTKLAH